MANDRKRRKIHISKIFNDKAKKSDNQASKSEQSEVKNQSNNSNGSGLRVVSGTRKKRRIIRIVLYAIIIAIIITVLVINYLSPTGLIESMQNSIAASGKGSLPVNVYSANPEYMSSFNGLTAILNDSYFELYNSNGKLIKTVSHGMSDPQLECSEARYLLFDRERYKISVLNYSNELYSRDFDNTVVAADIGRNGTFAVVTDSDTYQNTVHVYNKNNDSVFTWNSAQYYITDVAVSDDGKKIAVSLINSKEGSFESYLYIMDLKSATPKYRYTFDDIVSSITSCGDEYMLVNGFDRAFCVPWNGGAETDIGVSGVIRCYDNDVEGYAAVVCGRSDNEYLNKIIVLSDSGKVKSSFDFNTIVADICVGESTVAVLSEGEVYLFDLNGKQLKNVGIDYKGKFIGVGNDGEIVILDNTKLSSVS